MSLQPTDHDLTVATPENVSFGYALAGLGSRFMAAAVDTLIIVLLQAVVGFLAFVLALRDMFGSTQDLTWAALILIGVSFVLFWGYYVFFELAWNGQTPGKRWVGLRVQRVNGQPITAVEALIRNLVRLVDFMPAAYGAGIVTMFIDSQSRRLGDLAAGTVVVWERSAVSVDALVEDAGESQPMPVASGAAWPQRDQTLAAEFLDRGRELPNRAELSRLILTTLYAQAGRPVPEAATQAEVDALLTVIARGDEAAGAQAG